MCVRSRRTRPVGRAAVRKTYKREKRVKHVQKSIERFMSFKRALLVCGAAQQEALRAVSSTSDGSESTAQPRRRRSVRLVARATAAARGAPARATAVPARAAAAAGTWQPRRNGNGTARKRASPTGRLTDLRGKDEAAGAEDTGPRSGLP